MDHQRLPQNFHRLFRLRPCSIENVEEPWNFLPKSKDVVNPRWKSLPKSKLFAFDAFALPAPVRFVDSGSSPL
jgi:hypothetical protein